jgi:arylsulfatase A-like enzyme
MKNKTLIIGFSLLGSTMYGQKKAPNIIFIMADDHASQAVSCYGGILSQVLPTPNIDRIATEGARLTNCFVTNSISTPSRGAILTGQYSHKNGVYTLSDKLSPSHPNVAKELQKAGYETAIVGKWHLGTEPAGFDYYNVLPGQGRYHNPVLIEKGMWNYPERGETKGKEYTGHSTDVITSEAIRFMEKSGKEKPFFLMCHYKAPHREWQPAERFKDLFKDMVIPEPENLLDTYEGKGQYAGLLEMSMEHLNSKDLKTEIPEGLTRDELRRWAYQLYIKDYLRCIAGIDENIGRLLDFLDENGLTENTLIIYTADQGFFLGEHGWFDKRLMYEECLRMPFLIRYPEEIAPGTMVNDLIVNIDFAPLFLDYAGAATPAWMQGESFRSNLINKTSPDWRQSVYYRYWMHGDHSHNVTAHYGIRTNRYKLIFYYGQALGMKGAKDSPVEPAEWELYDLLADPAEMNNIYNQPGNERIIEQLKLELIKLKSQYGDEDDEYPKMKEIIQNRYW